MEHSRLLLESWKKIRFQVEIFGIFCQKHPLGEAFFFENKSCSKWAQMKFRENKFAQFSSFLILLRKRWKKSDSSLKFSEIYNLESDFFLILQKNLQCSKIFEIYLSWTSSEPIFSKIRGTFLSTHSLTHYKGNSFINFFYKEIPCKF